MLDLTLAFGAALAVFASQPFANAADAVDQKLKDVFAKAKSERVAVVGIGDSNQRFGGHGWSKYMAAALSESFGCWGSGAVWANRAKEDAAKYGDAPEELAKNAFSYWYLPAGETARVSWRNGQLSIPAEHPMDLKGPLRFSYRYGSFKEGEGSFMPSIRVDQLPWTILASSPSVKTASGSFEAKCASVELPADPARTQQLMFSAAPVSSDIKGPFCGECMQVENLDKRSGIAYSTLYARGGQSLFNMLSTLREEFGEARAAEFFKEVRAPLTGSKTCIVMISSALNDRNSKSPSIGPKGGFPGDSPEAFADNLRGIVDALEKDWILAGGSKETIFFAFMPSHPLSDPDDPKLTAYREEAVALAKSLPNAGCILLPELVGHKEMAAKKYYDKGTASNPHLSPEGYEAISNAVARALSK